MTRRLLNLLTALSLLLGAAVCVVWMMSHTDAARRSLLRLEYPARGGLQMHTIDVDAGIVQYAIWRRSTPPPAPGVYTPAWTTAVPLAVPAIASLVVILLLTRWRRKLQQLHPPGLCPACGYDLRATPGRCPECGSGTPA